MPGHSPSGTPEQGRQGRTGILRRGIVAAGLSASALVPATTPAIALDLPFDTAGATVDVASIALMLGAVSAALLSAFWVIRERSRVETENAELKELLADATTKLDRYHAMLLDKNRRIVIWDGCEGHPKVIGDLPADTAAPTDAAQFLAFQSWLTGPSAERIGAAAERLRGRGERFDFIIETRHGDVLEAQGRVSGGTAFIRFVALGEMRTRMATLGVERDRLAGQMEAARTLFDAIDMPAWMRAADGRLEWVNAAYAHAVEATSTEDAVARGTELLGTQARTRMKNETTMDRPFADTVSTVVRGNRTIYDVVETRTGTGFAGIAVDISELQAVRDELKQTLLSHSETLDHLASAVAIFDTDHRLQFYNQAFQTMWGLDTPYLESRPGHGELLEKLRADGKLPEQHAWRDWKETVLAVYRSVEPAQSFWHLDDGQTLNVFAAPNPRGGATVVFENLTKQVDLEARYNTLVRVQGETIDHLSEGVAVFGADGQLKLSNPAFRILWAISEQEARPGTHIRTIVEACRSAYDGTDGWQHFAALITGLDEERRSHRGRFELTTGLILDYAVVPLPNAQTMLTFVNVTDAALVERALTDKNEALRKAEALKNDFVKHVSYELRTPLTNIIGFADLLKTPGTGPLSERQADYVEHIATSSSVLLMIVNDILDLATVDAGIMRLDLAEVDVGRMLSEVEAQMSDRLKESDLTLKVEAPARLGSFVADPQRVRQILVKLLSNAANHAPEGSQIRLKCRREDEAVVFTVSDNGPGIPKHLLKTIFSRFETHGTAGRKRGAGLGLSIVESFVSLHDGTVEIDSVEGRGTTVTCRLPANRALDTQAAE